MLSIFQSLTLEGWVDILYTVADGFNFIVAALLFVLMVLFGAFLIMNLTLAVIWMAYDREKQSTIEDACEKQRLISRAALEAVIYNLYISYKSVNDLPSDWPISILSKIDNLHDRLHLLWQTMEKAVEPKNPCDAGALMAVIQKVLKIDRDDNGTPDPESVKLEPSFPIIRKAVLVHDHLVKNRGRFANFLPGDEVKLKIPDTLKIVKDSCGSKWTVGVDIAENEIGTILYVGKSDSINADKVAVKFKKGTWLFNPSMLKKDMDFEKSVALDPDDQPIEHAGIQFLRKYECLIFEDSHIKLKEAFDKDAQQYDEMKKEQRRRIDNTCGAKTRKWCCFGKSFWCCGTRAALEVNASPCFKSFHGFITGAVFEGFIVVVIVVNTIVLMMDMYPVLYEETFGTQVPGEAWNQYSRLLEILNFVFSCVFLVELVLKNIVLGFRDYFRDGFNIFDSIIVLLSIVELIVAPPTFFNSSSDNFVELGGAWSALRAFRLFRLFKLARSWKKLRMLLAVVARTLGEVSWFLVLLGLFIFIFGLLGVSLFANQMRFDSLGYTIPLSNSEAFFSVEAQDQIPRSNFDDLGNGMIVVFQVLSGENWNTVMYDAIRAAGLPAGVIYFLLMIILGAMIVLELFVAILLGGFGDDEDDPPPPLVMRILKKHNTGDLTEKSIEFHVAACSPDTLWPEPAEVVDSSKPESEWAGKVLLLEGITPTDTEAAVGASFSKPQYTIANIKQIVDDCKAMWSKLSSAFLRAQSAGAIGIIFVNSDDDPFTINQLETIDGDIVVEGLDIPIIFPIGFSGLNGDADDEEFTKVLCVELRQKGVTVVKKVCSWAMWKPKSL